MVEYEVNLEVDAEVGAAFRAWLSGHVQDMLALPGFVSASCRQVVEPAPPSGRIGLCVRYLLIDRAALARYLQDHAPAMRGEGLARFGGRFQARRRVLEPA